MLKKIISHLLSPSCLLCKNTTVQFNSLCFACEAELPWLKKTCRQCALPLITSSADLCGTCISSPPYFDKTASCFYYQQPIETFITKLKFHHQLQYAELLGNFLVKKIQMLHECLPQCILPVPLHKKRLWQRGFNQAIEIAKPIAKQLHIPIDYDHCIRSRYTEPQSALPAKQRLQNVKNAFHLKKVLNVQHVALLDDVMTTGNTANMVAKLLKKTGVARIDVWCCARTTFVNNP